MQLNAVTLFRSLLFNYESSQDPMNPNETVIVIRSLVPGGVAQQDGRLIPGDRLLFVNDTHLENATLDEAVQVLKSAPKGVVRVGVAKPLPCLPESNGNQLAPNQVSDTNNAVFVTQTTRSNFLASNPTATVAPISLFSDNSSLSLFKSESF